MKPLAPEALPLDGQYMVEASAGTGKTYTIALLYLRLVLERELGPEQILVVTYTRAATAELKRRIRSRLEEALAYLNDDHEPDAGLCAVFDPRKAFRDRDRHRLRATLLDFDRAAITTIHGFAQRTLQEQAFETAERFDVELLEDDRSLLYDVVADYWTQTFYSMELPVAQLLRDEVSLTDTLRFAREVNLRPGVSLPEVPGSSPTLEQSLRGWHRARAHAQSVLDIDFVEALLDDDRMHRGTYNPRSLRNRLESVAHAKTLKDVDGIRLPTFGSSGLRTKGGAAAPKHPFFEAVDAWVALEHSVRDALRNEVDRFRVGLAHFVRREMRTRLAANNAWSFDALLRGLHQALHGPGGDVLVAQLQARLNAALIDEFQDTDPVQYAIFKRVFSKSALFLIGDPKQAIYGFRGADVFAYLDAARTIGDERLGLSVNYRSDPGVLSAIETLFSHSAAPFVLEDLAFVPVHGPQDAFDRVENDPLSNCALQFLFQERGSGAMREQSVETTARLIASALSVPLTLKERDGSSRPVTPADFAVLTRSNATAFAVQSALRRRGVPAVFRGDQSVFGSVAGAELQSVLAAMLEPNRQPCLRAAMLTRLVGQSADALLGDDGTLVSSHALRFLGLREDWREHGVMRALRRLMECYEVERRALAQPDGERFLTDLLHLIELVHRAEHELSLGPERVFDWLLKMRTDPSSTEWTGRTERQMRLETDEESVQLFTIHTSKGLEFPLVVCPDLWACFFKPTGKPGPLVYHEGDTLALDLARDPEPSALNAAINEWHAENRRLLYVALTRAKHRVYIPWGRDRGFNDSALASLIHSDSARAAAEDSVLRAELDALCERSGGTIGWLEASRVPDHRIVRRPAILEMREPRRLPRSVRMTRTSTSYSSWAKEATEAHFAERDLDRSSEEGVGDTGLLPSLPAGAATGLLVHAFLEEVDFRSPSSTLELAHRTLRRQGQPETWAPELVEMAVATARAPIELGADTRGSLHEADAFITELEFTLPLAPSAQWLPRLHAALVEEGGLFARYAQFLTTVAIERVAGFLRGFIDWAGQLGKSAVVVDYKSNVLFDYSKSALELSMIEHHYVLQAMVYSVALRRFLLSRGETPRFGGAHYLFLRGLDSSGQGVCSLHPSEHVLKVFENELLGQVLE